LSGDEIFDFTSTAQVDAGQNVRNEESAINVCNERMNEDDESRKKTQIFPHIFAKFLNVSLFSSNLRFLLNVRFFATPYFDHDVFMHHALHITGHL